MKPLFFMGLLSLFMSPCFSYADVSATQISAHQIQKHERMRSTLPVDINQASATQLTTLKGIGAKRAAAILAYRTAHGPFKTMTDFGNVKGIGAKGVIRLQTNNPGRIMLGLTTITKHQA